MNESQIPEPEGPNRSWIPEQPYGVANSVACSSVAAINLVERLAAAEASLAEATAEAESLLDALAQIRELPSHLYPTREAWAGTMKAIAKQAMEPTP